LLEAVYIERYLNDYRKDIQWQSRKDLQNKRLIPRKLPRPSYQRRKAPPANGKTPVLFRFKNDFLERIDAAAKKQKLPRQAWVRTVIAEALEPKGL
jgi:hypothetical protein